MVTRFQKGKNRAARVRAKLEKTKPRLSVFRSLRHIWAQVIDDSLGVTVAAASSKALGKKRSNVEVAREVGKTLAERAIEKKIENVVFDRGAYKYHGQVRSLAEGAREGGLKF